MKATEFFTRVRRDANVSDPDQVLAAKLSGQVNTAGVKEFSDEDVKNAVKVLTGKHSKAALPSGRSGGTVTESKSGRATRDRQGTQETSTDYAGLVDRALEATLNERVVIDEALVHQQADEGFDVGQSLATVRSLAMARGMRQGYKDSALKWLEGTRHTLSDHIEQHAGNESGLTDEQELELLSQKLGLGKT